MDVAGDAETSIRLVLSKERYNHLHVLNEAEQ